MSWLSKLLGSRTRKVASGQLPLDQLLQTASGLCIGMKISHGVDVVAINIQNTNSMIPTMDANCVLLLEKVPYAALSEGDIVTYRGDPAKWGNKTLIICHRLNERTPRGWWPLGDGNTRMDPELVTEANFDRRVCGILYGARTETTDL